MNPRRRHHPCVHWVSVAVMLLGMVPIFGRTLNVSATQVSGTSYTSPNYGYTVTWQLPWYVVKDEIDTSGYDVIVLADSRSRVSFSGGRTGLDSPLAVIEQYQQVLQSDSGFQNFRSVVEPQCSSGSTASNISAACYRADLTYDDGTQESVGIYLKAWIFEDGVDLLMSAFTQESILSGYIPHWSSFGVYPKGVAHSEPTGGCSLEDHHGIEFCFDPSLTDSDRSDIVEGVRLGQDAVTRLNPGETVVKHFRVTGLNAVSPEGDGLIGTTLGNSIAVYAGSRIWRSITPIERIEGMIHEYFHVFQNSMISNSSIAIPQWFSEGSAESFGYMVASQIGVTEQAEFYSLGFYKLTSAPVTGSLRDFGTSITMDADEYTLAYMAVQYLLGSKGMSVEALANVYQEIHAGTSFESAFSSVFGVTLDQFYADFETWGLGMPKVYSLDDDFYPNDHFSPPASISWTSLPQQVDPGNQIVFVAQTAALADCNLTLNLADQSIQRTTWANGQGEIFWLVSLPDNAEAGDATVNATCGGVPISSMIFIS